jgi:hypothetical protein
MRGAFVNVGDIFHRIVAIARIAGAMQLPNIFERDT